MTDELRKETDARKIILDAASRGQRRKSLTLTWDEAVQVDEEIRRLRQQLAERGEPTYVSLAIATAPERIRLQISDDEEHYGEPFPGEHSAEVTWCSEPTLACEVPYVRADLAAPPAQSAALVPCSVCGGDGMKLNYAGEPDECPRCKGNTVEPAQSAVPQDDAECIVRDAIDSATMGGTSKTVCDKTFLRRLRDRGYWLSAAPSTGEACSGCRGASVRHTCGGNPRAQPSPEYASENPLGGPASMLRTAAYRIEQGEDYDAVLADYGLSGEAQPIPMILHCPACGAQHIDAPAPGWDNPPHRSHLCHHCGIVWRPADVPTTGVESISTAGKADTRSGEAQPGADAYCIRMARQATRDALMQHRNHALGGRPSVALPVMIVEGLCILAEAALNRRREAQHPDDVAVDGTAAAMKAKLAQKRAEGRGGWNDKSQCSQEFLSQLLHEHVAKGDPVDVANLAMMLHQRGERVLPAVVEAQPGAGPFNFEQYMVTPDRIVILEDGGVALEWQRSGGYIEAEICPGDETDAPRIEWMRRDKQGSYRHEYKQPGDGRRVDKDTLLSIHSSLESVLHDIDPDKIENGEASPIEAAVWWAEEGLSQMLFLIQPGDGREDRLRRVLQDLLTQIDNADGTAQLVTDDAEKALAAQRGGE